MSKICSVCGRELPLSDFYVDKRRLYRQDKGAVARCKKCDGIARREYSKKHRKENSEYYKAKSKEYSIRTKKTVISAYGGRCACCKESKIEFLAIDHINGGGTKERKIIGKSGIAFYSYLIKKNFPSGYRVLCHNCNQSLGKFGYCPHKSRSERE